MAHNQEPKTNFTWRGAMLGLLSYIVLVSIVATVFILK